MKRAAQMRVTDEELSRFLLDRIDSVPHLEALLLLWGSRPRFWSKEETAARLFVDAGRAGSILDDLVRHGLISAQAGAYAYLASPQNDPLVGAVVEAYRTDLIRISTAIHSKASSGVIEFARAFELKRKRNPK